MTQEEREDRYEELLDAYWYGQKLLASDPDDDSVKQQLLEIESEMNALTKPKRKKHKKSSI